VPFQLRNRRLIRTSGVRFLQINGWWAHLPFELLLVCRERESEVVAGGEKAGEEYVLLPIGCCPKRCDDPALG